MPVSEVDSFTKQSPLLIQPYRYTFESTDDEHDEGTDILVCTDPAGAWRAGVSATVWDASLVLAKHFEKACRDVRTQDVTNRLLQTLKKSTLNVIELGCGCSALPSLVLSRASRTEAQKPNFVVTDKSEALPLLRESIKSSGTSNVEVAVLDWTSTISPALSGQTWHLVIMSDVLAFPELYSSLIQTISTISSRETLIYIAYERRNFTTEVEFFRLFGQDFRFEMVPELELDEQFRAPGEIYLYRGWLR